MREWLAKLRRPVVVHVTVDAAALASAHEAFTSALRAIEEAHNARLAAFARELAALAATDAALSERCDHLTTRVNSAVGLVNKKTGQRASAPPHSGPGLYGGLPLGASGPLSSEE